MQDVVSFYESYWRGMLIATLQSLLKKKRKRRSLTEPMSRAIKLAKVSIIYR